MNGRSRHRTMRSIGTVLLSVSIVQCGTLGLLGTLAQADVRYRKPVELSEREIEVLRLVALGCSDEEIAEQLHLSRRSASQHVDVILQKFRANSRSAAAMVGVKLGLFSERQNDVSFNRSERALKEDGIGLEVT